MNGGERKMRERGRGEGWRWERREGDEKEREGDEDERDGEVGEERGRGGEAAVTSSNSRSIVIISAKIYI